MIDRLHKVSYSVTCLMAVLYGLMHAEWMIEMFNGLKWGTFAFHLQQWANYVVLFVVAYRTGFEMRYRLDNDHHNFYGIVGRITAVPACTIAGYIIGLEVL